MYEYCKPLVPKTLEYVETKAGTLRGFKTRGIYQFLNVQYGECKRWQQATPVQPWKGIKNALQFGARMFPSNMALTPWDSCGVAHETYDYAEDALNLNVWSPSIEPGAKKAVMVWIHGGGYATGSAMEMQCHHGENLSRFGDVVVVTINHRLNAFGFLDMSRFGEKYANSGNAGLSDLVLALQWVHDNIAAFGGDPDRVLIYGQSGGGAKVRNLLQTPAADGLYSAAVCMSGAGSGGVFADESNKASMDIIAALEKKLGISTIEEFEALTPEELVYACMEIAPEIGFTGRMGPISMWKPYKNEYYLGAIDKNPIREHAKKIPVMIGCTIAEGPQMRIFNKHDYTEEQQKAIVEEAFPGQDTDKLIKLFKKAWPGHAITDAIEMSPSLGSINYADRRAAAGCAPTYVYYMSHEFPQEGGRLAWHCADIPIVFHNSCDYPSEFRDGVVGNYEDGMCSCWINMAKYGNPNNEYLGVEWPEYKTGECAIMILDNKFEVRNDFNRELNEVREGMTLNVMDKYTKFTQVVN